MELARLQEHCAARSLDRFAGVAFKGVTKRVISGDEKPRSTPLFHDSATGPMGERIGVIGPMDAIRRARFAS